MKKIYVLLILFVCSMSVKAQDYYMDTYNTQTITTGALTPGIYTFTVTVTDGCGGNVNMSLGPVTINALSSTINRFNP